MNILIAVAHPNELKIIKESIKKLKLFGVNISYIQTGIGNYETIFNLTKKFNLDDFDFILNIGICGYIKEKPNLIQVSRVINFSTKKELIIPISFIFTDLKSILCSEQSISNPETLLNEKYVDMESYGIEFIANKFQIPRLILKLPSDKIGDEFNVKLLKESCDRLGTEIDYKSLFEKIINYISTVPKEENYNYLKEKYYFTFQEFEIMKGKINRFESLNKLEFKDFFKENSNLEKSKFIQKLENHGEVF